MKWVTLSPAQALSVTYRKIGIREPAFHTFSRCLRQFAEALKIADQTNESEEHVKNHIITFLQEAFYKGRNLINTYHRVDRQVGLWPLRLNGGRDRYCGGRMTHKQA